MPYIMLQWTKNVYPGEHRCNGFDPHAKWHVESAVAFLDLFYVADEINRLTKR